MSLLIDELPSTVMIDGLEYEINIDFRTGILFEQLSEENIDLEEKARLVIMLYFSSNPMLPENIPEALNKVLWFYRCGKEPKKKESEEAQEVKQRAIFSYELDDAYIYSAFMQQYRIDLNDVKMHWWKFRAMFQSLSECKFTQIMGYRSANMADIPKYQKAFYAKMKKLYELPDNRTDEEKERMIIAAFDGCF